MPIDVNEVLKYKFKTIDFAWDADKIILYHLGLGAGADWLNPDELRYTYEKNLQVLPSYGVLPSFNAMPDIVGSDLLAKVNKHKIVHGEHELVVHQMLPTRARVSTESRVEGVYGKGSGVLLVIESDTRLKDSDDLLLTNRWSLFLRGEEANTSVVAPDTSVNYPDRDSDYVHETPIIPQLSQIYRLSGDKVAFHVDPEVAKMAGFDTPIMHGLCTYGVICKAVVDSCAGGDASRLSSFRGRFANPAFCGQTIVTRIWKDQDGYLVQAESKENGQVLFTASEAKFKD